MNFALAPAQREHVLGDLFARHFGDDEPIARELYAGWDELQEMQTAGMAIGGHSHTHVPLATLSSDLQQRELQSCADALRSRLRSQSLWPFAFPYGSFNATTCRYAREAGFDCAFTIEAGSCDALDDVFRLRRFDANDVDAELLDGATAAPSSVLHLTDPSSTRSSSRGVDQRGEP
jgi:peptidoglycan/xylan/chitin deacetylase (PgdA/CDA1 family)